MQSIYTCAIPASPAGTYNAVATFNNDGADTNYFSATSSPATSVLIAQAIPTLTLSSSGGTAPGSTITFTAVLSGTALATAPSDSGGGVSWTIGGGSVSACSNANANIGTLSGAVRTYTCTITNAATGTYIATAAYQGDTNYTEQEAGPLTVAISANSATVGAITPNHLYLRWQRYLEHHCHRNECNANGICELDYHRTADQRIY